MRLFELSIPDSVDLVGHVLEAAGWEKLGEGYYASVYGKPDSPYVLKIFEYDDSYVSYLKLIEQYPNIHFPKIKGRLRVTPKYRAVRMEKLSPTTKVNVGGLTVDVSGMLNAYMIDKRYQLNNIQIRNRELFDEYAADKPKLIEALDLINEELVGKYALDLNSDNIMQRADGTIVITDPLYV